MNIKESVRTAAKSLGLLGADDKLKSIDSIEMVDLVVTLEEVTGIPVPAASVREECFASLDTLTALMEQLAENQK